MELIYHTDNISVELRRILVMLIIFYDDELLFWPNAHFKKDLLCYAGDSHNASCYIVFNLTNNITCNSASWSIV